MRLVCSFALLLLVVPAFSQDLQDPDPKKRAKAAKALSKEGSEAIVKLQPLLSDTVLDVRIEAVKAIVEIGTQRSLDALIQATRDNDPEIQIRAADGLVNFYLPGYVKSGVSGTMQRAGSSVMARFSGANDQVVDPYVLVRAEVILAAGKLARGGVSMESRANAARAVGVLRGRAALPDLYPGLRSKNDTLIFETLIAIQKIRDPAAGPEFSFLLRDLNEKIQIAAIETTGILRNREALPQLKDVIKNSRSVKVQRAALVALSTIPDEANRPILTHYLNDKDDGMRAAAAEGLGRLKNPADAATFDKAFSEERKMNARLAQAFALVKLGRTEMTEFSPLRYLVNSLNSKAWRGVASGFLVKLTREASVRTAIYPVVPSAPKEEKIEIAKVLALSGDKDSVTVLDGLTKDGDADVAHEGLRALRSLKARNP